MIKIKLPKELAKTLCTTKREETALLKHIETVLNTLEHRRRDIEKAKREFWRQVKSWVKTEHNLTLNYNVDAFYAHLEQDYVTPIDDIDVWIIEDGETSYRLQEAYRAENFKNAVNVSE